MKDILLITNTDSSEGFIKELLMNAKYNKIYNAYNYSDGVNLVEVHPFDLVMINAPMRTELGDRLAKHAAMKSTAMVMFIARETTFNQSHDALSKLGVICVKKPVVVKPFQQLIKMLETTAIRTRSLAAGGGVSMNEMDDIRMTEVAKWHLISRFNMSESQASRVFEQFILDSGLSRVYASEQVIDGAINEGYFT
ncbi:MAG TPA: hypothetical protein DCS67_02985 [Clostridiales bacterium UBA8960]|nr:hypothetical protein [Clostridiales bacterium UBA8960]